MMHRHGLVSSLVAPFAALGLLVFASTSATPQTPQSFSAPAAWAEFEGIVRAEYAYFDRPGIDGDAILAAFAPAAKAAATDAAFVDVLQVVGRNFADAHFVVGPFDDDDFSVIPTGSDFYVVPKAGAFVVEQVRAGGDAMGKVRVGDRLLSVNGKSVDAAIAETMGRPFAALTSPQLEFGANTAVAGRWDQPRTLTVQRAGASVEISLPPTSALARRVRDLAPLEIERFGPIAVLRFNNSLGDNAMIAQIGPAVTSVMDARAVLIDLRNTPSGGNTTVARALMGHFTQQERPYQTHVIPWEQRTFGVVRKFTEIVAPRAPFFPGRVFVVGGRWTGSMGEGLMVGFDALGATTLGSDLGDLLGGIRNVTLNGSAARIDLATEALFHVDGRPREAYRPKLFLAQAERDGADDPALTAVQIALGLRRAR